MKKVDDNYYITTLFSVSPILVSFFIFFYNALHSKVIWVPKVCKTSLKNRHLFKTPGYREMKLILDSRIKYK